MAVTKIIIAPTARTPGAGEYEFSLEHKAPLLEEGDRTFDLGAKVGVGERLQFDAKFPLDNGTRDTLFAGKYAFLLTRDGLTAAAIGAENVGSSNRATPYLVVSHLVGRADYTAGTASGTGGVARFFVGIDYDVNDRLQVLADYDTGMENTAGAGFQYQFARDWEVKSGIRFKRDGTSDVVLSIKYVGRYD